MSDVVLFYPRSGIDLKKVSVGLPLSLLTIASELVQDFSVKIIDQRVNENWEQELINELKKRPLCVGITAMTGHQIHHGLNVSRIIREYSEGIPIVWGGMHVTLLAQESIVHPLVDIIVKGDGEWVFRDLVRALAEKKSLDTVGSLYWKEDGKIRYTPDAPSLVLDQTFPYPFELVNVEDYVSAGEYLFPGIKRVLPFMASRGCPFKCTFCSEPVLTKVYKMMKPELVYERISDMVKRFKLDMIQFYDEEFFVNAKWATRIAELINGEFKWWTQTRANDLLRVDLKKLDRCGLYVTAPGLESGSNRLLNFIKKKETISEYIEANRRLAQTGILAMYNLMMGFPTETPQEVYETMDLGMQILKENPRAYLHSFSLFTALPGTELLEQSKQWGLKPPTDLEGWSSTSKHNFVNPWIQDNLEMYLNLAYTSRFVGPRAKMAAQRYFFLPGFAFDLYDRLIQWRWRKRILKRSWDVRFLQFIHKTFINTLLDRPVLDKRNTKPKSPPKADSDSIDHALENVAIH